MRNAILLCCCLILSVGTLAGGVAITSVDLRDNGDDDGFADSNETVELRLVVQNTAGVELTDVTLQLSTPDSGRVCLVDSEVVVGNLLPGETRLTDPFVFHVSAADRVALGIGPYDSLQARLDISAGSAPTAPQVVPSRIALDLDLNVSGGGAATSWFEGFEGSGEFGSFVPDNMDFGLHDDLFPENGAADGYRCQYHNPVCYHASCAGQFQGCSPGSSSEAADAIWWQRDGPESFDGGRAFTGSHSLYYGVPLDATRGHTTPSGILEGVESFAPIALGYGRACHDAPEISCMIDSDCPLATPCVRTGPTLSFYHQVSLLDSRTVNSDPGTTADRAVVSAQVADEVGTGVGPWKKLYPYWNAYDQTASAQYTNCSFDPIDDGSDEDDRYPGIFQGISAERGPSSTCSPEPIWAYMGDTDGASSTTELGNADGPGLAGSSGVGTWVESRVDLSQFRGRNVRIRFLVASMRIGATADYESAFMHNPDPGDDGWWIDDIAIEGAMATQATVSIDTNDNSGLPIPDDGDADGVVLSCDNCTGVANPTQADLDSDGWGTACDCNDGRPATYPGAPEVNDGLDNQCPNDPNFGLVDEISGDSGFHTPGNRNEYSWLPQSGATAYEVGRGTLQNVGAPVSFCTIATANDPVFVDVESPAAGEGFLYLVRASLPNPGSWGRDSSGQARPVGTCGG